METIDLKKLEVAINYVQRIADGHNPVNNMPAQEDSVLNDPNVIRCMFFIKEVLEEVHSNGGLIGNKKVNTKKENSKKEPFPFECLKEFRYQEDNSIVHLLMQIQAPVKDRNIKKIAPQTITNWLKKKGYLTIDYCHEVNKDSTMPTDKGKALGIYAEIRTTPKDSYLAIIYNRNAQEFLVKNLEAIVNEEVVE